MAEFSSHVRLHDACGRAAAWRATTLESNVTVTSVDESVKKAESLGAKVLAPRSTSWSLGDGGRRKPGVGMMAMPPNMPPHVPSYWMPYFQVSDVDASADKAKGLGAKIMVGPQDIPGTGRSAIVTDPQGAMFAIYSAVRK